MQPMRRLCAEVINKPRPHTLEMHMKEGLPMPVPWPLAVMFLIGIVLISLVGKLLLAPGRIFWRILASGVAGALLLAGINLLSRFTGFSVPVNPFSALTVGFLGLPGALLIIALNVFL